MIKFFQKLKAKKGFTLVELIVVIAIIGVLAAILIPTMLGYVTSSRVTSADSTAANIQKNIDAFLTNADTAGYGMKRANSNVEVLKIDVTPSGWKVTADSFDDFNNITDGMTWAAGSAMLPHAEMNTANNNPCNVLALELANLFPDLKQAYIEASLVAGHCAALYYTADTSEAVSDISTNFDADKGGWTAAAVDWDGSTAGVSADGLIVGTSPKLALATGS